MIKCLLSGISSLVGPCSRDSFALAPAGGGPTAVWMSEHSPLLPAPPRHKGGARPSQGLQVAFFRSVATLGADWDRLAALSGDVFLQKPYLSALEQNPPKGMRFGYMVFYRRQTPVGIAICQTKRFSAAESISDLNAGPQEPCFFNGLANWMKKRVANRVDAEILVCGNLLVTGQHGYWFDPAAVTPAAFAAFLPEALQTAAQQLGLSGHKIDLLLVKDIPSEQKNVTQEALGAKQYYQFEIQPNMVLDIPGSNFEEYLGAMTTKYRTRAKRAFKKGEALEIRTLSAADMRQENQRMYAMYKDVVGNAGFNVVDLHENYLLGLQEQLSDAFRVTGYYLEGQLVAFCSTLKNGSDMEAHFVGYDKTVNHDYQLYLNMLYHMVRIALAENCRRIVFARTALEIKSSIGATPQPLYNYLKHQNPLINRLTASIVEYLKPVEEWVQRHPFKHHQPEGAEE